ncbi:MAG TPA: acyltransferase [Rhizomicrobium sp.]|nr:acyltransferase [Rhizomicrobium sp.]
MKRHDGGKLSNIQALRAAAATLVIFVHFEIMLASIGLPAFGNSGVDLFFVISGYIMVHTTYGHPVSAADFLKNRVARIVPLYWLATLVVFLIAVIVPQLLQTPAANAVSLIKSLLFIPFERVPGDLAPVFFLGWTLNYEMFFYLLFAAGLLFRCSALGLGFTLAALAALAVAGRVWPPEDPALRFYTFPIMLEFALGMLVALFFRKEWTFSHPGWRFFLVALVLLGLVLLVAPPLFPQIGWLSGVISRGLPAAMMVWAALALESRGDFVKNGFWVRLGDASYAMYLTHPFVAQIFQKLCIAFQTRGLVSLLLLIAAVAAIMTTALVVHAWIEKPLTRVARRLLGVVPRKHAFHVA